MILDPSEGPIMEKMKPDYSYALPEKEFHRRYTRAESISGMVLRPDCEY